MLFELPYLVACTPSTAAPCLTAVLSLVGPRPCLDPSLPSCWCRLPARVPSTCSDVCTCGLHILYAHMC